MVDGARACGSGAEDRYFLGDLRNPIVPFLREATKLYMPANRQAKAYVNTKISKLPISAPEKLTLYPGK